MEMVYVPAGSFMMGREDGLEDQQPVHEVYLDAYWMDRTEVTNAMFAAFLNEEGNQREGEATWLDAEDMDVRIRLMNGDWAVLYGYEDHPVTEVSWYGALAYCDWAERRLPSEAEWENAARGEDGRRYPWGNDNITCDRANFIGCQGGTSVVGTHPTGASLYGVMDMAGNVWEWVADWYAEDAYSHSSETNPTGPLLGTTHVLRGGSWALSRYSFHLAVRRSEDPGFADSHLGFRCAVAASP